MVNDVMLRILKGYERVDLKLPNEVGSVPIYNFFLRVDSGTSKYSAIHL